MVMKGNTKMKKEVTKEIILCNICYKEFLEREYSRLIGMSINPDPSLKGSIELVTATNTNDYHVCMACVDDAIHTNWGYHIMSP
jgi:hypothetical protein